jgi:phage regulator Rha-like protein
MSDLVLLHHNEPMTTSLAIAACTENEHGSVILLVRKFLNELEEFGEINFQTAKPGNSRFEIANRVFEIENCRSEKGRQTEFAFLNEQQSTLLVTFMRNSPVVIEFKKALVRAFFAMRDSLQRIQGNATSPQFITSQASHGADIAVAADRTFRSFMRAARSAGMALPAALKIANIKTVERTGIDMLAELDVNPDATPARPLPVVDVLPDPFVEALVRWASEVAPESSYRMADILRIVSGIEPTSKAFQRQSPKAGAVLRSLGWVMRFTRAGGLSPHRYWVKR